MKKILSLLLLLCICLSCFSLLISCNSQPDNSDTGNSDESGDNGDAPSEDTTPDLGGDETEQEPEIKEPEAVYSEGLKYSLSSDRSYCIVTGIGSCRDARVAIPPTYNDIPVKAIAANAFVGSYGASNSNDIYSIILPDSITEIGKQAFANNKYLKKIVFGNSIEKIGSDVFYACPKLMEVHISDISSWCNITFENGLSTPFCRAGVKMYLDNKPLTELIIPEGVTEIKKLTFSGWTFITKVKIADSVQFISGGAPISGDGAFSGCTNLTDVEFGESLALIGYYAFSGCSMLLRVSFKDPSGWHCSSYNIEELELSAEELSVPGTAATYLASTYCGCDWMNYNKLDEIIQ